MAIKFSISIPNPLKAASSFINKAIFTLTDITFNGIKAIWNDAIVPLAQEVFAFFGIEGEYVVFTQKSSDLFFGDNTIDVLHQAKVKAVIGMTQTEYEFFDLYKQYSLETTLQLNSYYRYAESDRYIYSLPSMQISGIDIDYDLIDSTLDTALGFAATRLSLLSLIPDNDTYFKHKLQVTPYFYLPYADTLTFTDPYGVVRTDYNFIGVTFNSISGNYEITVSRTAEQALFWIEGPSSIIEGDSITYTIKCNRTVPVGKSVTANISYSGTAPGTDYTPVTTAVITAGNTEVDFIVTTNEDVTSQGARTLITTLDSITNTGAAFEAVDVYTIDSVTTTIKDDEGKILTVASHTVTEASGSAIVPVKLENATSGAFTVNYDFIDGTAIGGSDYTNTPGILNFAGTIGEVQNITVPIATDAADDKETFTIYFTSCSDGTVDYSQTSLITILDGSDITPVPGNTVLSDTIIESNYTEEKSLVLTYHATADPDTDWFYWIYKYSDGTYPALDTNINFISDIAMLPIAILRQNKTNINTDKTTEVYKTTSKLLKIIDLNLDDLISNSDDNPGIGQVDDLFVNFAVCPNSTHESVSKYLWLLFYDVIVTQEIISVTEKYMATFKEQDIENAFVWTEHLYTPSITGSIPNDYDHSITIIPEDPGVTAEGSTLTIRKKLSSSTHAIITIANLNGIASIKYENHSEVALSKLGDDIFTIPISYYILNQMNNEDQMQIYQYILRIDAYSIDVQYVEWYESSGFLNLFEFFMIAITIYTLGQATGPLQVLKQLLVSYLVTRLVVYLAELTGNPAFAAAVGVVAMIALSDTTGASAFDFTSAEDLILVSTNFANNLSTSYDVVSQDLADDLKDLNEQATARLEEIKEVGVKNNPITAEFLVHLNSVDTTVFPAIKAQYDFDLIYNYDRLIADYYDINLSTGVI